MTILRILITYSLIYSQVIYAIRDVHVKIPAAVRRSDNAVLNCYYDMEGESLYSIKWYKGRREFYRYTPKETPAMKVFPISGVSVVRMASNESQLTLQKVWSATTGKYSCEISADAPSFHTGIGSGDLEVVEIPETPPAIHGIKPKYRMGDLLRANCTSKHSRPAANLTWLINDERVDSSFIRPHKPIKSKNDLEISILGLHFIVSRRDFQHGKMKIKCIANIHKIYHQHTEKIVEEIPINLVSTNHNYINLDSPSYFDSSEIEIDEQQDLLTNIPGDMSSLSGGIRAQSQVFVTILAPLITIIRFIGFHLTS